MEDKKAPQLQAILEEFNKRLELLKEKKEDLIFRIKTIIETEKIKKAKEKINTLK